MAAGFPAERSWDLVTKAETLMQAARTDDPPWLVKATKGDGKKTSGKKAAKARKK